MHGGPVLLMSPQSHLSQLSGGHLNSWPDPLRESEPEQSNPNSGSHRWKSPVDDTISSTPEAGPYSKDNAFLQKDAHLGLPSWTSLSLSPNPSKSNSEGEGDDNIFTSADAHQPVRIEPPAASNLQQASPRVKTLPERSTPIATGNLVADDLPPENWDSITPPKTTSLGSSDIPDIKDAPTTNEANRPRPRPRAPSLIASVSSLTTDTSDSAEDQPSTTQNRSKNWSTVSGSPTKTPSSRTSKQTFAGVFITKRPPTQWRPKPPNNASLIPVIASISNNNIEQVVTPASTLTESLVSSSISIASSLAQPISLFGVEESRASTPASNEEMNDGQQDGRGLTTAPSVGKEELAIPMANEHPSTVELNDATLQSDVLPNISTIPTTPAAPTAITQTPSTPSHPKSKKVFVGVVITKPPLSSDSSPNKLASHDASQSGRDTGRTTSLAEALSSAFSHNARFPTPQLAHPSLSTSASSSTLPPVHARHVQTNNGRAMAPRQPRRERPLTQAQIDDALRMEIGVIGFGVDRVGDEGRVLRINLRFLSSGLRPGGKIDGGGGEVAVVGSVRSLSNGDIDGGAQKRRQKGYAIPEKSRTERYYDMVVDILGPESVKKWGRMKPRKLRQEQKPKNAGYRSTASERTTPDRSDTVTRNSGVGQEEMNIDLEGWSEKGVDDVVVQLRKRMREESEEDEESDRLGKRVKEESEDGESDRLGPEEGGRHSDGRNTRFRAELGDDVRGMKQEVDVDEETAGDWTTTVQKLVKGKTKLERQDIKEISHVLEKIGEVKSRVSWEVLETSRLGQSISQLSELGEIPFGDDLGLRGRAEALVRFWSGLIR